MFLLHPKIAQLINARSAHTPFAADGLNGATGNVLLAQQSNRLLAFGHQSLASTGGTASLCGGAAGPGGGPAGACGGSFSGSRFVVAGGSNGACGGVPVGGQEIGRFYYDGSVAKASPVNIDNVEEVAPLSPPGFGGGGSLLRMSLEAGPQAGREDGSGSTGGGNSSNMVLLSNKRGKTRDDNNKGGGKTCPHPPNNSK